MSSKYSYDSYNLIQGLYQLCEEDLWDNHKIEKNSHFHNKTLLKEIEKAIILARLVHNLSLFNLEERKLFLKRDNPNP